MHYFKFCRFYAVRSTSENFFKMLSYRNWSTAAKSRFKMYIWQTHYKFQHFWYISSFPIYNTLSISKRENVLNLAFFVALKYLFSFSDRILDFFCICSLFYWNCPFSLYIFFFLLVLEGNILSNNDERSLFCSKTELFVLDKRMFFFTYLFSMPKNCTFLGKLF